jgi:hypothetical protein
VATFHVDRDGRGGVAGSDATWTVAARAGDATKPYATIAAAQQQVTAANPAGGDTIRVHRETTTTPYPEPVTTGLAPTVKNTLIAHDLAGEGRPTVDGMTLATATRWRVEGMTFGSATAGSSSSSTTSGGPGPRAARRAGTSTSRA